MLPEKLRHIRLWTEALRNRCRFDSHGCQSNCRIFLRKAVGINPFSRSLTTIVAPLITYIGILSIEYLFPILWPKAYSELPMHLLQYRGEP